MGKLQSHHLPHLKMSYGLNSFRGGSIARSVYEMERCSQTQVIAVFATSKIPARHPMRYRNAQITGLGNGVKVVELVVLANPPYSPCTEA